EPLVTPTRSWLNWLPVAGAGVAVLCFLLYAVPPSDRADGLHLQTRAARLPVLEGGRIQPLDTLAINSLLIISNRSYYYEEKLEPSETPKTRDEDKVWVRQSAIKWLFEVMTAHYQAEATPMFKVDQELATALGLPQSGTLSFKDLQPVKNQLM